MSALPFSSDLAFLPVALEEIQRYQFGTLYHGFWLRHRCTVAGVPRRALLPPSAASLEDFPAARGDCVAA